MVAFNPFITLPILTGVWHLKYGNNRWLLDALRRFWFLQTKSQAWTHLLNKTELSELHLEYFVAYFLN